MNKRIIIIGAGASGKDYLKQKFGKQGFELDVSYTTRPPRDGEVNGVDYNYISEDEFALRISHYTFYEWAQFGDYKYGTGKHEWDNKNVFIMETHGVSQISPEDRKNCFVIYLKPPIEVLQKRFKETRGWDENIINKRIALDQLKFDNFTDYNMIITSGEF